MNYKNTYSTSSHEVNTYTSVPKTSGRKKRKKYRLAKNIIILFIVAAFSLGIGKGIALIFSEKSTPLERSNQTTLYSRESLFVLSPVNRPTEMLEKTLNWKFSIVPDSNHIGAAQEYAYDTKEIRNYISGKTTYTGKDKLVFLTFDDGANQKISPIVLDTLKEHGVHGTFFIVGGTVGEKNKSVLLREIEEGHAIAIHSFTHNYKILYPNRVANVQHITKEYMDTLTAMKNIFGPNFNTRVFRYPGGHMSWKNMDAADAALSKYGVEWIDWNALCGDGEPRRTRPTSAQGMYEFTVKTTLQNKNQNVIVVLMHDAENKKFTAEALPKIIQYYKDQGYVFGVLK